MTWVVYARNTRRELDDLRASVNDLESAEDPPRFEGRAVPPPWERNPPVPPQPPVIVEEVSGAEAPAEPPIPAEEIVHRMAAEAERLSRGYGAAVARAQPDAERARAVTQAVEEALTGAEGVELHAVSCSFDLCEVQTSAVNGRTMLEMLESARESRENSPLDTHSVVLAGVGPGGGTLTYLARPGVRLPRLPTN